jgi:nucleoside-diphosphate-sugar epimerase
MRNKIFATGKTGTIGKYFDKNVLDLKINLAGMSKSNYVFALDQGDIVIHAAGIVGNTLINADPKRAYDINVVGTKRLAEHALKSNVTKFVYISSSHVYAHSDNKLDELSPTDPTTIYAEQKLKSEEELLGIFRNDLSKLCIIRVFSVLDWDVKDFTLGGGIKKLTIPDSNYSLNNTLDVRDFLTPKQIAKAIVSISTHDQLSGIVNLCSGIGIPIEVAAQIMLSGRNFKLPEDRIERTNSQVPFLVGDNYRLISYLPNLDLVWKPSL